MTVAIRIFLLCTLCLYSADSAPTFTEEPPTYQIPTEGNNITLEWRYTFGSGSFRELHIQGKTVLIVHKFHTDKDPYIAPAYRGRLLVNATDTYTSITLLGVNRTDTAIYTLTVVSSSKESTDSKVKILVIFVPEVMITGAKEQFVVKGRQILLTCQYNAVPPVSEVLWEKDGSVITSYFPTESFEAT